MIENPSNLAEHVSNLTERVATDIKQLRTNVSKAVLTVNNVSPVDGNVDVDIPPSVHVGTEAPEDTDTVVWVDPESELSQVVTSVNGVLPDEDGNVEVQVNDKISKAGDTVNGQLVFTTPQVIRREDKYSWVEISGGTDSSDGARLVLTGEGGSDQGAWKLDARDTSGDGHWSRLQGTADGKLTFQDKNIVRSVNGSVADQDGNIQLPDTTFTGGTITSDILPDANATLNLGSETKKFKSIYADEVHISQNTLYIGDTAVLGTDQNTINIKADPDQSIMVKTSGLGSTQLYSENAVLLKTNGASANINLNAAGSNSEVSLNATARVAVSAPDIVLDGTTTITNLNVTGTVTTVNSNNLTVKDNLIEINSGETGNGVSAGTAGIKINRGDALPYLIQFDESDDMFKIGEQGDLEIIASQDYVTDKIEENKYTHPSTHSASMITGLANIATSGKYSDLVGAPASLPASGGNADTVGGFTVATNVPADAKFTDTVYTLPDATTSAKGGVKIGNNITVTSGTISLSKANVTSALGYTPPEQDTTYSAASQSAAGLMSANDKKKLDGIASGANAYTHPSTHAASMITGLATVATSGKYSDLSGTPTIPTKLPADGGNADTVNGFTVGTNVPADAKFTDTVYTLPEATNGTLGGVKVGSNISVNAGTISLSKANVTSALGYTPPEQDTTYGIATTSAAGLMSTTDRAKLDGIEAGANKYIHPSHTAKSSGLYKITVDSSGHVSAATAVTKSDITALGIPAQDTTYTLGSFGVTSTAAELNVLDGITATTTELNVLDGITATTTELNYVDGVTSNIQTQLNNKLSTTGTAAKATADASGNVITSTYATKTELSTGLADKATTSSVTTALSDAKSYTDTKVAALVDSSPAALDTLNELAAALGDDPNFATTVATQIGSKANSSEVVKLSGNQTIAGTKTFSSTISGSISGNAATATKATQDGSGNVITSTYLTKSDASSTYLGKTAKAASATVADSANAVAWGNVSGKPDTFTPSSHNQASNTITAMTGYSKASSATAIAATDSLNTAVGKLEKALDGKLASTGTAAKATADASGNNIANTYATKTYADTVVAIDSSQPTTTNTKVWIVESGTSSDAAISKSEFDAVAKRLSDLETAVTQIKSNYLTTATASSTYATKSYVDTTFPLKSDVANTYATVEYLDSTFATKVNLSTNYITKAYAEQNFVTKSYVDDLFMSKAEYQDEIEAAYSQLTS